MKLTRIGHSAVLAASLAIAITAEASAHAGITEAAPSAAERALELSGLFEAGAGHSHLDSAGPGTVEMTRTAASRTTRQRSRTMAPRRTTQRRPRMQLLTTGTTKLTRQQQPPTANQAQDTSPLKPFREDGIKFYHPWGNDID